LAFLVILKNLLGGKSLSIAAPASYWYLKAFPIAQISKVVDYIIFMAYDLHGQVSSTHASESSSSVNLLFVVGLWQCVFSRRMLNRQLPTKPRELDRNADGIVDGLYPLVSCSETRRQYIFTVF
jgi:hypothetical protein